LTVINNLSTVSTVSVYKSLQKKLKNLKKLVDGLETNCYIYYVEIDCSISTRKIENFEENEKISIFTLDKIKIIFYI
jgi:hypothetical protein